MIMVLQITLTATVHKKFLFIHFAKQTTFALAYPLSLATIDRGGGPPLYWVFAPGEGFPACLVSASAALPCWQMGQAYRLGRASYSTRHSFGLPFGIYILQL